MENLTILTPLKQPIVFELESFEVPRDQGPILFFLALLNYMVVLLANGLVMGIIVADRALHRPMNVMICNLAACDLLGGTAALIRLMIYLATGNKKIAYGEAIIQAFSVHTYGAAVQTILAAMAYDSTQGFLLRNASQHPVQRSNMAGALPSPKLMTWNSHRPPPA
ncbi:unnamed protein product [Merluccius merluccius]